MLAAAGVDALGHAAVVAHEGGAHRVGGGLDGEQVHAAHRQAARADSTAGQRSDHDGPRALQPDGPAGLVVAVHLQVDAQPVVPEDGLGRLAPLDDGHAAVLHQLAEAEVGDLVAVREAVEVGVDELTERTSVGQRVLAHQGERRAGDGVGDPEGGAEPLGEGRLAGAEVSGQQHDVAGPAQSGQRAATERVPSGPSVRRTTGGAVTTIRAAAWPG